MADAVDSKSTIRDGVPVQIRPRLLKTVRTQSPRKRGFSLFWAVRMGREVPVARNASQRMHPSPWIVLSSLAVCACSTNEGRHPDEQARTEAQTLRTAVELHRAQLPVAPCPGVLDLVDQHLLVDNSITADR